MSKQKTLKEDQQEFQAEPTRGDGSQVAKLRKAFHLQGRHKGSANQQCPLCLEERQRFAKEDNKEEK